MPLTTPQIIAIAKVSQALAQVDVMKGNLFSPRLAPQTPHLLRLERRAVEWMYDIDPTNSTLTDTSNYLFSLCRGYNLQAQNIINSGGGGSVAPVTPGGVIFPFVITQADFESDGISYNNPDIIGYNLMIFINEVSQQWFTESATTFTMTATGLQILLPGFDANSFDYTIVIQNLGTG